MTSLLENSVWKPMLLVVVLVCFACLGVAHLINPDRFIRLYPYRKGGEMLTEWNRFGLQVAGACFAGFALYLLYRLLRDALAK